MSLHYVNLLNIRQVAFEHLKTLKKQIHRPYGGNYSATPKNAFGGKIPKHFFFQIFSAKIFFFFNFFSQNLIFHDLKYFYAKQFEKKNEKKNIWKKKLKYLEKKKYFRNIFSLVFTRGVNYQGGIIRQLRVLKLQKFRPSI